MLMFHKLVIKRKGERAMRKFIKQTVWALLALVGMTSISCSQNDDLNSDEQKTHSIALTYYLDDVKLGELNAKDLDSIIGKTSGFSTKYKQGEQVCLSVEANEGYEVVAFESKTDPEKTGSFSYTFNLDKLEEFIVKFETIKQQQGYKIESEIYVDGVRKITTKGYNWDTVEGYTTGMGLYHFDDPATVTAFANNGYELVDFRSPVRNGNSTYTWDVKNNEKFIVQFKTKPSNFPVNCSISGSGTVKINGQPLVNGTKYPNGTYTLTAHPAAGWSSNWTTKQITVNNAAVNESVVFVKDPVVERFYISVSATINGGNPTPSTTGGGYYKKGETCTISTSSSSSNVIFEGWQRGIGTPIRQQTYTFTVTKNESFTAQWFSR